jgi:hypothetical protein
MGRETNGWTAFYRLEPVLQGTAPKTGPDITVLGPALIGDDLHTKTQMGRSRESRITAKR